MSRFNATSIWAWCRSCLSPTEISYSELQEISESEAESESESSFNEVQPRQRVYRTSWVLRKHTTFMIQTEMNLHLSVRELPGVEETLGERLVDQGFQYAYQLLRVYVTCLADTDIFHRWMEKRFGATRYETYLICYALDTWWFAIADRN